MDIHSFSTAVDLFSKNEVEKVKLISFYYQSMEKEFQFTIDEMSDLFDNLGMHRPNKSRLQKKLIYLKDFVRGTSKNHFRLHIKVLASLKAEQSFVFDDVKSEEIKLNSDGLVIPKELYQNTRRYLINLSDQINASYENNIFDGCAVLMRRLFEILLIHSYEHKELDSEIKDVLGNYRMLVDIVNNAKTNSKLGLSRNTKDSLDDFRELGNFSAHKVFFNARKTDIDRVVLNYRATIEELLYKSGIRK
ncbi:DUF4145 domain-containing protein [Fictibacillus sp. KU28468]|uniref:DUF4145 domain-containing protein n=1 Tax=Fictibacillus sp. KU28468 TaxID=2991053 RepID=UPI00223D4386|nr:DUF4145 domain-containing protein [Fictibacillus sp. KU28468]UZJ79444.1 DUF4145 domain-containing protein [Fictibacillus sp. KU28468]